MKSCSLAHLKIGNDESLYIHLLIHYFKQLTVIRNIFFILFFLCVNSCKQKESKTHVLDFNQFTIETPKEWQKINARGVDSYIGGIQIDSADMLSFDFGIYSNDLEEYLKHSTDTSISWTIYPPLSQLGQNRNSEAKFELVDGKTAKIIFPITSGVGVTGIYFDSLKRVNGNNIKLEIAGNNLKPANEKLVLQALRTLKFTFK